MEADFDPTRGLAPGSQLMTPVLAAIRDPLAGSSWSRPETVAGFAAAPPNASLMRVAASEYARRPGGRVMDIGCGAGRNAIPLAIAGWDVLGVDLSLPMLESAAARRSRADGTGRLRLALAPMDSLPVRDRSCDLLVAHGIWNLARSSQLFRRAVREAARVANPGAALFVFTFSRHTFGAHIAPIAGESFVFTEFSGEPQCFLTKEQLTSELAAAGFVRDPSLEFRELNRPVPGELRMGRGPVVYEALFRYSG